MDYENIILYIFGIMIIVNIFVWYLFGNSPTFEQTILGEIVAFLLMVSFKVEGFGERLNSLERRFIHLAKDFKYPNDRYYGG